MKYFLIILLSLLLASECFAQLANPKVTVVRKKTDATSKVALLPTEGGNAIVLIAFDEVDVLASALEGNTSDDKKKIYRIQSLEKARDLIRDALEALNRTDAELDSEASDKKSIIDADVASKKSSRPNDAELDPEN